MIQNLQIAFLSCTHKNLQVFGLKQKDLKSWVTTQADIEKGKLKLPEDSHLLTDENIMGEKLTLPEKDSDEDEEEKDERRSSGSHSTKSDTDY